MFDARDLVWSSGPYGSPSSGDFNSADYLKRIRNVLFLEMESMIRWFRIGD